MLSIYEIIQTSGVNDIRLFLQKVSNFPLHWHQAIEFLLILEGDCQITINDNENKYSENDIVLINSFSPHSTYSEKGCTILTLQINNVDFANGKRFDIDSIKNENNDYSEIKMILAKMIKFYNEASKNHEYLLKSLLLMLEYTLLSNYVDHFDSVQKNINAFNKLSNIIDYIQKNFKEDLSLSNVATKFFYSPSYLSRDFAKTIGIPFKKYLDNLRLSEAVNLLLTTNKSIEQIALESGFANSRSFVSLHRQTYGILPSEHRKTNPQISHTTSFDNYFELAKTDYLSKLAKYLDTDSNEILKIIENKRSVEYIDASCDLKIIEKHLTHNFKKFTSVGRASDLLKDNIRNMLKTTQSEIGFEYIKFHGLFDDDMNVYTIHDGCEIINFERIDIIFDFLQSINLKPLVQLSFMPRCLCKYPNKSVFFKKSYTSEPNDLNKWINLCKQFMRHILNRYGKKTIETWLYCVWNEAELSSNLFGFVDKTLFPEFYQKTYLACKEVCPSIKFGSTSMLYSSISNGIFEEYYLSNTLTVPDFINIHFYPIRKDKGIIEFSISDSKIYLEQDPHIMNNSINTIKESLKAYRLDHLPIYITEWNSTTSHRDLISDTAFKGSYVVKNIIDNYDEINSFGFWTLTDDIDELPYDKKLFHGGVGMMTRNQIKKPPYYAFLFLSNLKDNMIKKGKNYIITSGDNEISIVCCNYIHYNDLYANGELFNINKSNRYGAFRDEKDITFTFNIDSAEKGKYNVVNYYINRENGSCYDIWKDHFNEIDYLDNASIEMLKSKSIPAYSINTIDVENSIKLSITLSPYEIRLIKIKKIY